MRAYILVIFIANNINTIEFQVYFTVKQQNIDLNIFNEK